MPLTRASFCLQPNGADVYHGVSKDYTGAAVTPANFLNVRICKTLRSMIPALSTGCPPLLTHLWLIAMRAGAQGINIRVAGRLGGAEIARDEWVRTGCVPLHTLRSDIDYGLHEAKTTYGIIGVKVWICRGDYRSSL